MTELASRAQIGRFNQFGARTAGHEEQTTSGDVKRFAAWLFVGVFASRAFTSSSAYFADARRYLAAIQNHIYVIQAPGYWLFNRIAGLWPDAEIGISMTNWLFSAAGATVFYLAVRRMTSESVARVSSLAYATVFFAWLSGNVHSTYASQLFFPVAVFLCFLHYWESHHFGWLAAAGVLFAAGTGFRPSDGAFFAPAFLYGLSRCDRKHAAGCLAIVFPLCLMWLIPQQMALSRNTNPLEHDIGSHLGQMADGFLVIGFSKYAFSNAIRLGLPFVLALLPILLLIFGNWRQMFLWLWILPGMAFYLLIYFPEAPYLCYMLAALMLLAATNPQVANRRKIRLLAACVALNLIFYLTWRPIKLANHRLQIAEYVLEADAGKCTYYYVQHHCDPTLSQLLHVRGYGQPVPAIQIPPEKTEITKR